MVLKILIIFRRKGIALIFIFDYNEYGDIEWNIKLQLVMKEKQLN